MVKLLESLETRRLVFANSCSVSIIFRPINKKDKRLNPDIRSLYRKFVLQ